MQLHDLLEWDPRKDRINLSKHKVGFADAADVLRDEHGDLFHVEEPDPEHADLEDRFVTWGSLPADRSIVLRISWTDRSTTRRQVTRIISARRATTRERKAYAQEIRDH